MAVVLIGFFVLVTRRRALSQLIGFLLMDNGITTVGFLTTTGIGLVVELGVSLDILLAVLVLSVLKTRMREAPSATPTSTSCGSCTTDAAPPCGRPVARPRAGRARCCWLRSCCLCSPPLIYLVAGWGPRTAGSVRAAPLRAGAVITLAAQVTTSGPRTTAGGLLRADALSAFLLLVVAVVALWRSRPPRRTSRRDRGRAGRTRDCRQHSVLVQVFLCR